MALDRRRRCLLGRPGAEAEAERQRPWGAWAPVTRTSTSSSGQLCLRAAGLHSATSWSGYALTVSGGTPFWTKEDQAPSVEVPSCSLSPFWGVYLEPRLMALYASILTGARQTYLLP